MRKPTSVLFILVLFGIGVAAQTPSAQAEQSLSISSKPQAVYTSKARKNKFQGAAQLRVTFLENGEIGEIVDVTEKKREKMLKYGLTEQAIEAAKKIKFTPAIKYGQPVTVAKIVKYAFTLY